MPEISVVIPLYNGGDWIGKTLDSVFAQTRLPDEVVVVDDGSNDDGPQIAQRYEQVRLLSNPKKGANHARVFGLQSTRNVYVALLDQDDRLEPTHFERLSAMLDVHPQAPAAFGNHVTYMLGREPVFANWSDEVQCYDLWARFPFHGIASPSGVLFRRDALEQAGGWPTHIEGVADMLTYFLVSVHHPIWRTNACTWARGEHQASYSVKLRSKGRHLSYMDRAILAAEEGAQARIRVHPDEQQALEKTLADFQLIRSILEAVESNNLPLLSESIAKFESAYAAAPEQQRNSACGALAWMISLGQKREEDGRSSASYLLRRWPVSAPVTGRLLLRKLQEMVPHSLAGDYLIAAPYEPERIRLLLTDRMHRLRSRAKRMLKRR